MPHPVEIALTRRALLRLSGGALGLTGAALLVACGGGTPTAPTATNPPAPAAAASTVPAAPTATTPAPSSITASASAAPSAAAANTAPGPTSTIAPTRPASAAPSVAASAAPSAAPATAGMPPVKGIPQGRMPDGFFVLGSAAAPVTLTDYSDFL